ncbi:Long chain acyl-CoA synthetase 7 peroxisomal [Thoreauomyces humboldtii]|nr:Long chain acyl-CoA synthetase 7 peroxisomal [Thoreauomyces humboldtii]
MGKKADTIYTVDVPGAPDIEGETKPRRHYAHAARELDGCPPDCQSVHEVFLRGVKLSGDSPFLGTRVKDGVVGPFVWQSYNEIHKRVMNLASGYVLRGIKSGGSLGLFSVNRAEWIIAEKAAFANSIITVPLYDTLGIEAIEFIIGETELSAVVATTDKAKILARMSEKIPTLKLLIIMDNIDDELRTLTSASGIEVISILALEAEGAASPSAGVLPHKDTFSTICYTSGTTGMPKGVVLSHENLMSFAAATRAMVQTGAVFDYNKDDVYLSYLPLAHVFERAVQVCLTYVGSRIAFYQGDTFKLLDDVAELKPTIFASVPRLFNRIYDKVMQGVKAKGGLAAMLFNKAYAAKKAALPSGVYTHMLWDALVFSKVRARLGGRVRLMLTGAAPISGDVMDFLRICFSAAVQEGYGSTETSAGAAVSDLRDTATGHIGAPCSSGEIKLIDVPAMGYTSKDQPYPRGEICVRGKNVFKGYYKNPEKTAEVLTEDGWCRSGDIGMWGPGGRLQIIDRVKNIFKLAQGEYIAPEKIEMVYQKHAVVAQSFVYGDSLQASVVAVIVPDEDTFRKWAIAAGLPDKPVAELCKEDAVRKAVLKSLVDFGKADGLKGFENVKDIYLESSPFTVENDLMTPTFKLKRHEAKKLYQAQIDEMYARSGAGA